VTHGEEGHTLPGEEAGAEAAEEEDAAEAGVLI
jgi:hypothetical protein